MFNGEIIWYCGGDYKGMEDAHELKYIYLKGKLAEKYDHFPLFESDVSPVLANFVRGLSYDEKAGVVSDNVEVIINRNKERVCYYLWWSKNNHVPRGLICSINDEEAIEEALEAFNDRADNI